MSLSIAPKDRRGQAGRWVMAGLLLVLAAFGFGGAVAQLPPLVFLAAAFAAVVIAARGATLLCVLLFWTLPYMAINLPTGSFTLKLCDGIAYLFAGAWAVRTALLRDKIALPPATVQVLIYLSVLALSTAFEPPVPRPYVGDFRPTDRNSPLLRSGSLVIWLGLSWLVVVAIYNVAGQSRMLFRRCVCSHILSGGFVSLVSLIFYGFSLAGIHMALLTGHIGLFLNGNTLRLAGPMYEPLFFGFYLVTTIPATLVVSLYKRDWLPRGISYTSLTLQCVAMLLTFSTGGWAGLLAALLVLMPFLYRSVPRSLWLALGILIALGGAAAISLPKSSLGQIILGQINKGVTGGTREGEFRVGAAAFSDYPVLGIGPAMATFYFGRYHPKDRVQKLIGDQEINNVYINVAAESGVVGLLAFLWAGVAGVVALFAVIRRHGMARVPVLAALTASLVGCAVQYTSLNSLFLVFFPVLIGLATAGARLASLPTVPEAIPPPGPLVRKAL